MPRPMTKAQFLQEIHQEQTALEEYLATLTPEEMIQPGAIGKWSVKDVLAHLVEWEQMLLGWHKAGLRGKTPSLPAEGFKWSQLPALNQHIYEQRRDQPPKDVLKQFRSSYRQILKVLHGLSEKDLFTPGRYAWTKKNSLATYFIPGTSSHYRWARTEMRKGKARKASC